jgi:hypothetical protein
MRGKLMDKRKHEQRGEKRPKQVKGQHRDRHEWKMEARKWIQA